MVTTKKSDDSVSENSFSLDAWMDKLATLYPDDQLERIREAAVLAIKAHAHQRRASGEPYVFHVFEVAEILVNLHLDNESIIAALLHDVVEDTSVTLEQVESVFGHSISVLVDGVTKIGQVKGVSEIAQNKSRENWGNSESLRKMLLAMVKDVRVILIKLADRLHNMRTLKYLDKERQTRIATETMDIFAPLASRMGIWQIKWELEDLSFRYLHPGKYKKIASLLAERRLDREAFINEVITELEDELAKVNIKAELSGRAKHIYSIWRKMEKKGVDFKDIFDVSAVRVLVDTVADCYGVLGITHMLWKHIPNEFDDYITTPKGNNYQSLHTAVIGPDGKILEVQIRTREMHEHAELGVASHWLYKEGSKFDPVYEQKIAWLRQILEWKNEESDVDGFVDRLKSEIFEDRVYVLTPKGNVVDLAMGATPLDFAYHIHTDVGHGCRGAKINGSIVPLTYTLKTGDQIEILTAKSGTPSRDWLNSHLGYLKTPRARAKVRSWFTHLDLEKNITAGKLILDKELSKLGLSKINTDRLASKLNSQNMQELYALIGKGDVTAVQIAGAAQEIATPKDPDAEILKKTKISTAKEVKGDVRIYGVGNLLTTMAKCCKPAPGDSIIGYITKGRGITIHRRDCSNILRYGHERLIEVSWSRGQESTYPVDISVLAYDRQGLLMDITNVLSDEKVNVLSMNTITDVKDHMARMKLTLEVTGISKLSRVLSRLTQLSNVLEAKRVV
ncbi:MAG TPA: GTP diphosphokinase [Gammaproteobacteria bacterium]|nr:GTP diphosphokinase [Gammaproteobacteria bacterium]